MAKVGQLKARSKHNPAVLSSSWRSLAFGSTGALVEIGVLLTMKSDLRIACLLPSATDICVALGLGDYIVGVTHECSLATLDRREIYVLTESKISESQSQGEIDSAVKAAASCRKTTSLSLYPLRTDLIQKARPNVILTQDLCGVCAPDNGAVTKALEELGLSRSETKVVTLTPQTLEDVLESFATVAVACGVRGEELVRQTRLDLKQLHDICNRATESRRRPRVLLLEWLDPPYTAGHWMLDMLEQIHAENVVVDSPRHSKPKQWSDLTDLDPDVVCISCCGFDLERNVQDTRKSRSTLCTMFPNAVFYACDSSYFVSPGPHILGGTAILAKMAYRKEQDVLMNIDELSFAAGIQEGNDFLLLDLHEEEKQALSSTHSEEPASDIEDWYECHRRACDCNETTYIDPATGYQVFTEKLLKSRGKCCGSGCRHCPYAHENLANKAAKIQQPAFLHCSLTAPHSAKVLFFSGGKDSFLAIRATLKQANENECSVGIVLLTTFDATSREIAHQEVSIETVVQQAQHLDLSLVGVPLHRTSSEGYVARIEKALAVVSRKHAISALVFGDLHLPHIVSWRNDRLGALGYPLEYPLLRTPYGELEKDLENSGVHCVVSSSTVSCVSVGDLYDRNFREGLPAAIDAFGENGEFHTVARVWEVCRQQALGLG